MRLCVCLDLSQPWLLGYQGSYRLEKYLILEGLLEKSLEIKFALKSS